MPYCTRCGAKIPEDEEARFCPNCGAPILLKPRIDAAYRKEEVEPLYAARKMHTLLFLTILFLNILVTSAGALSKVESPQAQVIVKDFREMEKMLRTVGVQLIFGNNMMYCLVMFIPFVGPISGFYVLYSTGRVLAALGYVLGADPLLLFLSLLIYPHSWLEYISYSLAISESIRLSIYTLRYRLKGLKAELPRTAKYISLCAALLLTGALIEMALITLIPSAIPS